MHAARSRLQRVIVVHAVHGLVDRYPVATRGRVAAYRVVEDQDRACTRGIQEQALELGVVIRFDFGSVVEVAHPRGLPAERERLDVQRGLNHELASVMDRNLVLVKCRRPARHPGRRLVFVGERLGRGRNHVLDARLHAVKFGHRLGLDVDLSLGGQSHHN